MALLDFSGYLGNVSLRQIPAAGLGTTAILQADEFLGLFVELLLADILLGVVPPNDIVGIVMRPVRLLILFVVIGCFGLFVKEGVAGRRRLLALFRPASTAGFTTALLASLLLLLLIVIFVVVVVVVIIIIVVIFVRRELCTGLVVSVVLLPYDDVFLLIGRGILVVVLIHLVGAEEFPPTRTKELATSMRTTAPREQA